MTTEDQFEDVEVNIDPEQQDVLVTMWVGRVLSPASRSVFEKYMAVESPNIQEALYISIFNEMVINVLQEQLTRFKTNEPQAD